MGKSSGNVKGTVSQDGKTLVGDDGKSWTIANPDAVKGHEGHHVELKGSADASTNQIQVSSVKMLKGDKGSMKKTVRSHSKPSSFLMLKASVKAFFFSGHRNKRWPPLNHWRDNLRPSPLAFVSAG
jgi:hypothetical protein